MLSDSLAELMDYYTFLNGASVFDTYNDGGDIQNDELIVCILHSKTTTTCFREVARIGTHIPQQGRNQINLVQQYVLQIDYIRQEF